MLSPNGTLTVFLNRSSPALTPAGEIRTLASRPVAASTSEGSAGARRTHRWIMAADWYDSSHGTCLLSQVHGFDEHYKTLPKAEEWYTGPEDLDMVLEACPCGVGVRADRLCL